MPHTYTKTTLWPKPCLPLPHLKLSFMYHKNKTAQVFEPAPRQKIPRTAEELADAEKIVKEYSRKCMHRERLWQQVISANLSTPIVHGYLTICQALKLRQFCACKVLGFRQILCGTEKLVPCSILFTAIKSIGMMCVYGQGLHFKTPLSTDCGTEVTIRFVAGLKGRLSPNPNQSDYLVVLRSTDRAVRNDQVWLMRANQGDEPSSFFMQTKQPMALCSMRKF